MKLNVIDIHGTIWDMICDLSAERIKYSAKF